MWIDVCRAFAKVALVVWSCLCSHVSDGCVFVRWWYDVSDGALVTGVLVHGLHS